MKINKTQFEDLKKQAVNCLVTPKHTKYRLEDGSVITKTGEEYYHDNSSNIH